VTKRGERLARPVARQEWELVAITSEAARGWEELAASEPTALALAFDQLTREPAQHSERQHRLKGSLATSQHQGRTFDGGSTRSRRLVASGTSSMTPVRRGVLARAHTLGAESWSRWLQSVIRRRPIADLARVPETGDTIGNLLGAAATLAWMVCHPDICWTNESMQSLADSTLNSKTPVLVGGARTPIGRFRGMLASIPAVELGAHAIRATLDRFPGVAPDYIVMGNVLQAANGQNPGRTAAILGGVNRQVPGTTLNDVCLSSLSAVATAAAMVSAGESECVLVGGFDSMTRAPHALRLRVGAPVGGVDMIDTMVNDGLFCAIEQVGMGEVSDRENQRLGISRERQDSFALASHQRAAVATKSGRLAEEIAPIETGSVDVANDEGIRMDTSLESLSALPPAFSASGTITAGNASQLSDGGAAGLVTSVGRADAAGVDPLVQVAGRAIIAGPDSTLHLRPAEAALRLLERHHLTAAEVDLWEINEAFAGVALASIDALGIDAKRVNVNGGAVALGHPLAASGFRLVLGLAMELRRQGGKFGIATMCGGGGQGEAILLASL